MPDEFEQLIEELRRLVGHGATPWRVVTCWALRKALGVPEETPKSKAGPLTVRRLKAAIHAIEGDHSVRGRTVSAEQVRLALMVTLRFDKWALGVEDRRIEAMKRLRLNFSPESWRREFGPERDLLEILAEELGAVVAA